MAQIREEKAEKRLMKPENSDNRVKIEIIGCGQISEVHLREISFIREAGVVGVCELIRILAEEKVERFVFRNLFCNYRKMLNEVAA